jgi:polyhydroxybutyrate depolymerase
MHTRSVFLSALLAGAWLCAGCLRSKPEPGDLEGSLTSGGFERTYLYRLPATLEPADKPWPLVIALHGRGGDGAGQESLSHLSDVADREGFIVVYPDGVDKSWADGRPGSPAEEQGVDDVAFVSDLIDHFVATEGADPGRVFVAGMSNGGMMSYRLACDLSGKVAAVGPVAGLMYTGLADTCAPGRPVPILLFAGTADPIMPYAGGPVGSDTGGDVLSAADTLARWAALDGCTDSAEKTSEPDAAPDDGTTVTRDAHTACDQGAEARLYTIEDGGHTWPGGDQYLNEKIIGKTSRDLDASDVLWSFFQSHPMP